MDETNHSQYNKAMKRFDESVLTEKEQLRSLKIELSSLKIRESEDRQKLIRVTRQLVIQSSIIVLLTMLVVGGSIAYTILLN